MLERYLFSIERFSSWNHKIYSIAVHSSYIIMDKLFSHFRIIFYQWFLELLLWECVYFYSIYDEPIGFLQQLVNTHLQNGCFGTHNPLHYTFRRLFLHLISIQTILKRLQDKSVILLLISTLKIIFMWNLNSSISNVFS